MNARAAGAGTEALVPTSRSNLKSYNTLVSEWFPKLSTCPVPPGLSPQDVMEVVGPPGTACIVNTMHCLHRAGIPESERVRDMTELQFEVAGG